MELHQQIKAARNQAGLTQAELAQRAGVHRMDVSRLENGENLTMKTFLKIASAIPELTHLQFGPLELTRRDAQPIHDGEQLRARAAEVLENVRESRSGGEAPQQPADDAAARREVSLLRTFAELLLEVTGGRER